MKILMLGWELPPFYSGGLGVACYQLCKELALDGVSIDFVLPYQPTQQMPFMKLHGATPISAEALFNIGGAYDGFCDECRGPDCPHEASSDLRSQQRRYVRFVEQLVAKNDYDAVHAHDWLTFEAGVRAKQLANIPLIAHVHATEFDRAGQARGNGLVHEIEQTALLLADCIVAVSQFTKDLIVREYQIPPNKVEVVHNTINVEDIEPLDGTNAYPYLEEMKRYGYKVVVSLSRLTIQKGIYHLLNAARRALAIEPKLLFLIIGDGDLREELIRQAASLGIAHNVIFTGFLRGKQRRDGYAIGDMFVLPSVSEPFGLVALEAASYGNAVLLSKQSGVAEVLHQVIRFDFWDSDKLADAIVNVARHSGLQQQLAQHAADELRHLSWHTASQKLQAIYQRHSLAGVPV